MVKVDVLYFGTTEGMIEEIRPFDSPAAWRIEWHPSVPHQFVVQRWEWHGVGVWEDWSVHCLDTMPDIGAAVLDAYRFAGQLLSRCVAGEIPSER